jgi:Transglycosylase SLT domain
MRRAVLLLFSDLLFACVLPRILFAQTVSVERSSPRNSYSEYIAEAAQRFALPSAWLHAVMCAESGGNPLAVSPKGAIGLMQIMPATWAELRVRHQLGRNAYNPRDNIIAGAAYIRELSDRYGSPGWIAAYNAGPGRYEASLRGRRLPAETRAYVAKVALTIDGGGAARPAVIAAKKTLSWTRAPLFVAQPDRTSTASSVPTEGLSSNVPQSPLLRDVSGIAPEATGLFVTRVITGGRQ